MTSSELFDLRDELRDTWLWLGELSSPWGCTRRSSCSVSWHEYDVCVTVTIGCTAAPTLPATQQHTLGLARLGQDRLDGPIFLVDRTVGLRSVVLFEPYLIARPSGWSETVSFFKNV